MAETEGQLAELIAALNALAQAGAFRTQPHLNQPNGRQDTAIITSIAARLPMFHYNPEDGETFESWYIRNEYIISPYQEQLDDRILVSTLLSKLSQKDYAFFTNRILPKTPAELEFPELITTLKSIFKCHKSIFLRRFELLRTEYDGTSLEDYTGKVLHRFVTSEYKKMTDDEMQCMLWISGLRDAAFDDIRTKALQVMDSKPTCTVLELEAEIRRLLTIRTDSQMLRHNGQQFRDINAVTSQDKKNTTDSKPPSPCYRCGADHWVKDCWAKSVICNGCGSKGHLEKFCRRGEMTNEKHSPRHHRRPQQSANCVTIASSTTTGVHSAHRIYRNVNINGMDIRMQLDTGADVSLLSITDWKKLGKPKLHPPNLNIRSADRKPILVKGVLACHVITNGQATSRRIHVADTETLLGLDWITNANLLQSLPESSDFQVSANKQGIQKLDGEGTTEDHIFGSLQHCRSSSCSSNPNHLSPAENFTGHELLERQSDNHHGARPRRFLPQQPVFVKNFKNPRAPIWTEGVVQRQVRSTIYEVICDNHRWTRHVHQLKPRNDNHFLDTLLDVFDMDPLPESTSSSRQAAAAAAPAAPSSPSTVPPRARRQKSPVQLPPRQSSRVRRRNPVFEIDPSKKSYRK